MIPLPVVTKSVEDGSFQCLFFCIALFFTKRENNNEMRNSQDLEGKFVSVFVHIKSFLAGCPY